MRSVTLTSFTLLSIALLSIACDETAGGRVELRPGDASVACAHPAAGCACDQEVPIACYPEPRTRPDGTRICSRGMRYCRNGHWTGCGSIEHYELRSGPGIESLIEGPLTCNPCDPACNESTDRPEGPEDVTPSNSENVAYDSDPGGVELIPEDGTAMGSLPDSDGDGVPDVADDCPGSGAYRRSDGSCAEHGDGFLYHTLPYGGSSEIDPIEITAQVRTADVYFLMDTTGSMGGEISNLQSDLTSGRFLPRTDCDGDGSTEPVNGGIIGAIRCTIPDAWFGVGRLDDYPVAPYGGHGDVVYENLQDITSDISAAQAAVNRLSLHWGNDNPESHTQALWAVATGGSLEPFIPARGTCPTEGAWGYPCFRPGTIPIVVLFTDAPMHEGYNGFDYAESTLCGAGAAPLPPTTPVSGNETRATARFVGDAATTWTGWSGNTCDHRNDYGASCAWGGAQYGDDSRDVVFRFTVSTRRTIRITTVGSDYDTLISLRNSSFNEIACNEDYGAALTSELNVTLNAGTYYVVVMGWSTHCGNYRLSIGDPLSASGGIPCDVPKDWPTVVSALRARDVRVITVHSCDRDSWCHPKGLEDANALANSTNSTNSSGAPYVFPIEENGNGLSSAVVEAIVDLANYNRLDISARATDDPSTVIDERGFVESFTPVGWSQGSCTGISGSTFLSCLPGTVVDFTVAFRNDFVTPTSVPQVFEFFVEVVGDGSFVLERIPVRIVVPPDVPTYPPSGRYWRDHSGEGRCAENERPDWGELRWEASTPGGTSIRFELRTADTAADLDHATPVVFDVPGESSPVDVGAILVAAGDVNFRRHLRVTTVLHANSDRTATPTLTSMQLRYVCTPTE